MGTGNADVVLYLSEQGIHDCDLMIDDGGCSCGRCECPKYTYYGKECCNCCIGFAVTIMIIVILLVIIMVYFSLVKMDYYLKQEIINTLQDLDV